MSPSKRTSTEHLLAEVGWVRALARRLAHDDHAAEDLVQDTLLRGFGHLARHHNPIRNQRAYLLRCATHLWIDAHRRRERERGGLREVTLLPPMACARKNFADFAKHVIERY